MQQKKKYASEIHFTLWMNEDGEHISVQKYFNLPPKTTEWMAPMRTTASIEIIASGISGI